MLERIKALQEICWKNPRQKPFEEAKRECELHMEDILQAGARLDRFAPFFCRAFEETQKTGGRVESEMREIAVMKDCLQSDQNCVISGRLYLKMDSHLPVSGSIKARGGVYEVLKCAEEIALEHGLITPGDDYSLFAMEPMRKKLSEYSIAVGSTGNLGLSIGIISAALGFRVTVHMSADARKWKKDLLRSKGVEVVEYQSDYSEAVRQGRLLAQQDSKCHFVDDENSKTLFLGYAVAALRLKEQIKEQGILVDPEHPLMVYLPCGVGGGPGGVAFGLKMVFGDAVHCFFAEPVQACCMLLGLYTGRHQDISMADLGIAMNTAADGLAVGRASGFVGRLIEPFLSGCYTLEDKRLFRMLAQLHSSEGIALEPSALAGMYGPVCVEKDPAFAWYRGNPCATHLVWATGGSMVPEEEMEAYVKTGMKIWKTQENTQESVLKSPKGN